MKLGLIFGCLLCVGCYGHGGTVIPEEIKTDSGSSDAGIDSDNGDSDQSDASEAKAGDDASVNDSSDGSDSGDAQQDVVEEDVGPLLCTPINGTYICIVTALYDSCTPDSGVDSDGGTEGGQQDSGSAPNVLTFTGGFGTAFSACVSLDNPDFNYCSGNAQIYCNDGTQTTTYTDRYYVHNTDAYEFTVFSDVEVTDNATQTSVCHQTLIINYYHQ